MKWRNDQDEKLSNNEHGGATDRGARTQTHKLQVQHTVVAVFFSNKKGVKTENEK